MSLWLWRKQAPVPINSGISASFTGLAPLHSSNHEKCRFEPWETSLLLFWLEEPRTKRIVLKKEQDEDVKRLRRNLILFSQEQHISLPDIRVTDASPGLQVP
jgi:hypothetical protein